MKPLIDYINEGKLPRINPAKLNDTQLLQYYWDIWSGWNDPKYTGVGSAPCRKLVNYMYERYGEDKAFEITGRIVSVDEFAADLLGMKFSKPDDNIRQMVHKLIELNTDLIINNPNPSYEFDTKKLKMK